MKDETKAERVFISIGVVGDAFDLPSGVFRKKADAVRRNEKLLRKKRYKDVELLEYKVK